MDNGALKSKLDTRDWKYSECVARLGKLATSPGLSQNQPDTLDLRDGMPKVRNQGSRGTCSAFAGAALKEYHEYTDSGANYFNYMSPEFLYYYRMNKPAAGMYGRDVMEILRKCGIAPEVSYQYISDESKPAPSDEVSDEARKYTIEAYAAVESIDDLKHALNAYGVCWISFPVYTSRPEFWRSKVGEASNGGHAVAVVGYNKDGFILRNSWGREWNGDGHVVYPYSDWNSHWEVWSAVDKRGSPKVPGDKKCCRCQIQ